MFRKKLRGQHFFQSFTPYAEANTNAILLFLQNLHGNSYVSLHNPTDSATWNLLQKITANLAHLYLQT